MMIILAGQGGCGRRERLVMEMTVGRTELLSRVSLCRHKRKSEDVDDDIGNKRKSEGGDDSAAKLAELDAEAKKRKEWDDENDALEKLSLPSPDVLNSEEYKEYWRTILESKCYVVPDLGILEGKYSQSIIVQSHDMDRLNGLSKIAVEKYNKDNGTKYKLHSVVRGNKRIGGAGFLYYLTFKVVEEEESEKERIELQALVSREVKEIVVEECQTSRYFPK